MPDIIWRYIVLASLRHALSSKAVTLGVSVGSIVIEIFASNSSRCINF